MISSMPSAASNWRHVWTTTGQPASSRNNLSRSAPMRVPLPAATIMAEVILRQVASLKRPLLQAGNALLQLRVRGKEREESAGLAGNLQRLEGLAVLGFRRGEFWVVQPLQGAQGADHVLPPGQARPTGVRSEFPHAGEPAH